MKRLLLGASTYTPTAFFSVRVDESAYWWGFLLAPPEIQTDDETQLPAGEG
jgi:hypothetical protein